MSENDFSPYEQDVDPDYTPPQEKKQTTKEFPMTFCLVSALT